MSVQELLQLDDLEGLQECPDAYEEGASCQVLGRTVPPIYAAAGYGAHQCFSFLLECGLLTEQPELRPLEEYAVAGDCLPIIQLLEEHGYTFDTGLEVAAEFDSINAFRYFLYTIPPSSPGAEDPEEIRERAIQLFHIAAKHSSTAVLKVITQRFSLPSTLLLFHCNDSAIAQSALDRVDSLQLGPEDYFKLTPCARRELLARYDIAVPPDALIQAVREHDEVAARSLMPRCDINASDEAYGTALHYAISQANASLVALLLTADCLDINKCANNGDHPLHIAAAAGNLEVVKLLLAHQGINRHQKNAKLKTPLQKAVQCRHYSIAKLLK